MAAGTPLSDLPELHEAVAAMSLRNAHAEPRVVVVLRVS